MIDFIWNSGAFIIALGLLVTVHEYGHFWVARKNGVKVERFSVGFGRPLVRKVGKDGTEYVLAMIPLGGYVKMLDARVDDVNPEDVANTFDSKSAYQRLAIVSAGPLANFVFAFIALYFVSLIGVPAIKPMIGDIVADSIADKANLSSHNEIISIADYEIRDWQDVNLALVGEIGSKNILIKTKQPDSDYISSTVLDTSSWQFSPEKNSALASLGIIPFRPKVHNELAVVADDSPAQLGGLLTNDKLIAVNNVLTDDWLSFANEIKKYPDETISVKVLRQGEPLTLEITPGSVEQAGKSIGFIGVSPKIDAWPATLLIDLSYGPIESIKEGAQQTWNLTNLTFSMIWKLVTGDVSVKNLSGPIGIAQGAGNSAGHGFVYFLRFLALISINLGIINLLPLPVLDGGHILYYVIELCTGREVPEKTQEVGVKIGALVLLTLMSIGLFNDFIRVLN